MSKFITVSVTENIKLEYDIFGENNTNDLLFIHGGGTDYHFYEDFLIFLSKEYRVFSFSYPGFGKSSNISSYTTEKMVEVIDGFVEQLGLKKFVLVGHSMGGGFAIAYTALRPNREITKLVLLSPFIYPIKEDILTLSRNLTKQGIIESEYIPSKSNKKNNPFLVVLSKYSKTIKLVNMIRLYNFLKKNDLSKYISQIKIPVLGVFDINDIVLSPENQEKGLSLFNNKQIIKYTEYGHNVLFAKKEEILNAIKQ
jgi:pimeloyl-ACP methyl ester carboxylesterase